MKTSNEVNLDDILRDFMDKKVRMPSYQRTFHPPKPIVDVDSIKTSNCNNCGGNSYKQGKCAYCGTSISPIHTPTNWRTFYNHI